MQKKDEFSQEFLHVKWGKKQIKMQVNRVLKIYMELRAEQNFFRNQEKKY